MLKDWHKLLCSLGRHSWIIHAMKADIEVGAFNIPGEGVQPIIERHEVTLIACQHCYEMFNG